jgi:hypothetical protein
MPLPHTFTSLVVSTTTGVIGVDRVDLDPPWAVMILVGLSAASLTYWLIGRIADARDRS